MKKGIKVATIALGSLAGAVLIAVVIALYIVFTPKRLTPIVNNIAADMLLCPHDLEEVNLTFFGTFPFLGVEIKNLRLYNPADTTLLAVDDLAVSVNVKKAIDGDIEVRHLKISNIEANICIDSLGKGNYEIFASSTDTVEEVDTTPGGWTLKSIVFDENMTVDIKRGRFVSAQDSLYALVKDFHLDLALPCDTMARITMQTPALDFTMKETQFAKGVSLYLDLPVRAHELKHFFIDTLTLKLNQFALSVAGQASIVDSTTYSLDASVQTNDWQISEVLALLPKEYADLMPKEVDVDGKINLYARAKGVYSDSVMPIVDARVKLKDARGQYDPKALPYFFNALAADIVAHVDLNKKSNTSAIINKLYAQTGKTNVTLSGTAKHILQDKNDIEVGNPLCDITAKMNVFLPQFEQYIATEGSTSTMKGTLKGKVHVNTALNDVIEERFNRVKVDGDVQFSNLDVQYVDTIFARAEKLNIQLNTTPQRTNNISAKTVVKATQLHAQLGKDLTAALEHLAIDASALADLKDTSAVPTLSVNFEMGAVDVEMDTIKAFVGNPRGELSFGVTKRKEQPRASIALSADALKAALGSETQAKTGAFAIKANARYDKDAENILLKWNPRLAFDLHDAEAQLDTLTPLVRVPQIKFEYSNKNFTIDTSQIILGNSNFSLAGEVKNLGKWLRKEGELEGLLRFTSDVTDVNELMALVNASEDTSAEQQSEQDAQAAPEPVDTTVREPFIVPQRVNLALITQIKKAYVFDQTLQNLGGRLYIEDGTLTLEEMGFICEAAKLQLTAMYKTPRRNHLYVGLDYHMIDIDLQQLVDMIPQVDTLLPMLRVFRGKAQFHVAAETYVNAKYEIKPSTLRGALAIEGKDLVVLDNETFSTISKFLLFKKKTENVIDSISAQITLYKDLITVYPTCVSMDKYMIALGGNHHLDNTFDYHVCALSPVYLGVDVKGTMDDPQIKLAKAKYAKDFKPHFYQDVDENAARIRNMISNSLKKNVRIE